MTPARRPTWCDHPRTPENTRTAGGGEACLTCFRATVARYRASEKGRAHTAQKYWQLNGIDHTFTRADHRRRLADQGGVCALGGKPPTRRGLDVDHDHSDPRGRVRGLMYFSCSVTLGRFESGQVFTSKTLVARFQEYVYRAAF